MQSWIKVLLKFIITIVDRGEFKGKKNCFIKNTMYRKAAIGIICTVLALQSFAQSYKDAKLPVQLRVKDLLKRMNVEEKVAQLRSAHMGRPVLTDKVLNDPKKMDSLFGQGISMMNPSFEETMEQTISRRNALQNYLRTKTRLGIPTIFLDESHHGLVAQLADVFPTSIGLACSWDPALVTKVYDYIARQGAARGTNMVLAPVVDVTRDPRWGRTGETFGEDPYLNGIIGSAAVIGFQGSSDGTIDPNHVASTLKHFTGHGEPMGGNNTGPANYSVRALREYHMETFQIIIDKTNPAAIMPDYVEVDEIPAHANSWLLKDVLRKEWNYRGLVISDWFAIDQLKSKHQIADNLKDAAKMAFDAGVDVDLPYGINYNHLVALANEKKIDLKALNEDVARVLTLKFKLGLFDNIEPISIAQAQSKINQPEGRWLALKAAEESMVLLKNQNNILPLSKDKYKTIAVVGPCAAVNYTGDYSGISVKNVSILEGIKNKFPNVVYAKGVDLSLNGDTISEHNYQFIDKIQFPSEKKNEQLINEAVRIASQSDIIICAVGENEQYSREAWDNHNGDMSDLNLQANQDDLVKALIATGKPVIIYLAHARPLSINYISEHAESIVDGWFTGQEAGNAFANILFGDINPSGKLTISVPRSVGQVPVYYNHKPSQHFYDYVTEKSSPLYSFGYGLSYTNYTYSKLRLDGNVVSVDVTNSGKMTGDEIVQLYVHPKLPSVVQPVKALKDFARISLNIGETKTVSFTLSDDKLKIWDKNIQYTAELGEYEIMIGRSSEDVQKIEYLYTKSK